jgi:hypothetical protein
MKPESLLRHMLRREGKERHENPETGHAEAIPRHSEIANLLVDRPGHSNSTDLVFRPSGRSRSPSRARQRADANALNESTGQTALSTVAMLPAISVSRLGTE